jgi:hypothetical protein
MRQGSEAKLGKPNFFVADCHSLRNMTAMKSCSASASALLALSGMLAHTGFAGTRLEEQEADKSGLTCAITPNVQVDAGVNIGLTRSADDVNPFIGLTWRF